MVSSEWMSSALLKEIVRQSGIIVIIASHDPKVEEAADCVYELRDGRLVSSEVGV
jgi:ABC-type lipoprotein export system ATPase subunit